MNITVVPVHQVDQVWSLVSDGLDRSCMATGGDITAGDLWQQCRNGSAFLIVAHEDANIYGASVWRPEQWASGGKLRCLALYGVGLLRWVKPLRQTVIQVMENCGATSLVAEGLDKWSPLFRRLFPNAKRLRILYEEEIS